jgi:hypothetical protein
VDRFRLLNPASAVSVSTHDEPTGTERNYEISLNDDSPRFDLHRGRMNHRLPQQVSVLSSSSSARSYRPRTALAISGSVSSDDPSRYLCSSASQLSRQGTVTEHIADPT